MADPYARFNDDARRALTRALREALRLDHGYVGTEHLLLALLDYRASPAAAALRELEVSPDRVTSAVRFIIGRPPNQPPIEIAHTPRTKKVSQLAVAEARRMKHESIGVEHLLLGLVREREGIAADVLESLCVTIDCARASVARLHEQPRLLAADAAQAGASFRRTRRLRATRSGKAPRRRRRHNG